MSCSIACTVKCSVVEKCMYDVLQHRNSIHRLHFCRFEELLRERRENTAGIHRYLCHMCTAMIAKLWEELDDPNLVFAWTLCAYLDVKGGFRLNPTCRLAGG